MSTRLLVLGVVRFAQPVHGYDVRRELLSWQLEEVSNVKPGSIYSALKTLERDGLIAVVGKDQAGGRPERTVYELTAEGEKEFQLLLRKAWWTVEPAIQPLVPALTMLPAMPRDELLAVLDSRIEQLRSYLRQADFMLGMIKDDARGDEGDIPEHVRELMLFLRGQGRAELDWTTAFRQRVKDGSYTLAGEAPWTNLGPGRGAHSIAEAREHPKPTGKKLGKSS
jgi:DNA-binding PadR family transcriptional regulator